MDRNYSLTDNETKIEHFAKTVKYNTDLLINQMKEEMKNQRENFLEEETKKLENEINEYYNKNILEIENGFKIELSKFKVDKMHEHLKIRDDLQKKFFMDLENMLSEFIKSPDYDKFLLRSCERCVNNFNKDSRLIIYISAGDKDKFPMLDEYLREKINYSFEISDKIKLGGLLYHDKTHNIVLNETLDERLLQEKLTFNQ